MTTRTLVVGIPLPHVTFDNHSFASAPSLPEYTRLIVDLASVSRVVEEIVQGDGGHATFGRTPVANGPSTAASFGLPDLLAMRRREAEQFFRRAGVALLIACPDVAHYGIAGIERWRLYDWLPQPEGFRYEMSLLPGFGKTAVEVSDPEHPFAPYIATYGSKLRYRAYVAEGTPAARVFGRSGGGLPVAFELPVLDGRGIFVPPLDIEGEDRTALADTLFQCFERLEAELPKRPPEWIRKEAL